MRVALTTSRGNPALSPSDALLAAELARRGHFVFPLPWNDPKTSALDSDIVVLRSNWDYHQFLPQFERWLSAIDQSAARLVNQLSLVSWNLRKTYLLDLERRGVPIPRTALIGGPRDVPLPEWIEPGAEIVIKPETGASGVGVELVRAPPAGGRPLVDRRSTGTLIVQEFVEEVATGEWALVFFRDDYSHGFLRVPIAGEFRVNQGYGGTVRPAKPDLALISFARDVIRELPSMPTYARIDVVLKAGRPLLMEVEVNEPSLRLDLHPDAPVRFAEALLGGNREVT